MKIALFGATGTIGQRILKEAVSRGHEVTAIVRNPDKFEGPRDHVKVVAGNALDSASVAATVAGHEVVVSAISPHWETPQTLVEAAHALIAGMKVAGVQRLIIVGGAGSLEVTPGQRLMDAPQFPAAWKPTAQAHLNALNVYRAEPTLEWTFISPADRIQPGERTGKFRTGWDLVIRDDKGESHISTEDYAVALLDEIEHPKAIRRRMTVGY